MTCCAGAIVKFAPLSVQRHRARGNEFTVLGHSGSSVPGDALGGECFIEHDIDHLPAAAHIEVAGCATNYLYLLHLIGRYAAQQTAGLIVFTGGALAVDQNLGAAVAAAKPSATGSGISATRASTAASTGSAGVGLAGYAIKHVLGGARPPLGKIVGGINHSRIIASCLLSHGYRYERVSQDEDYRKFSGQSSQPVSGSGRVTHGFNPLLRPSLKRQGGQCQKGEIVSPYCGNGLRLLQSVINRKTSENWLRQGILMQFFIQKRE